MSSDPVDQAAQDSVPAEVHAEPWWRRSPPSAAAAGAVIGAATLWFGNMLNRVPLDDHATLGYLLMLPLLLIVPAFSAAGLRLAWLALSLRTGPMRLLVAAASLAGALLNIQAVVRFVQALIRIFSG